MDFFIVVLVVFYTSFYFIVKYLEQECIGLYKYLFIIILLTAALEEIKDEV